MTSLKDKSSGEKYWIIIVRVIALIIGFLPFIPNALYYLGLRDELISIGTSEVFFVVIGFVFLWGSGNFGTWANSIGKSIVNNIKKD